MMYCHVASMSLYSCGKKSHFLRSNLKSMIVRFYLNHCWHKNELDFVLRTVDNIGCNRQLNCNSLSTSFHVKKFYVSFNYINKHKIFLANVNFNQEGRHRV